MKTAALIETSSLSLPNDCYVYQISLINAKLAAISSDDSLRIIDPNTLRERGVRSQVHDGVTCSTALDHDNHCLLTAGRDTAIRSWDLRSAVKNFEIISGETICSANPIVFRRSTNGIRTQGTVLISRF